MNNERLDNLFREIREEKLETPISEVTKWIALSAASAGLFGLLSHFKIPFLLTKKILIMTTITAAIGIGLTTFLLSSPTETKSKTNDFTGKLEIQVNKAAIPSTPLKMNLGENEKEYSSTIPERQAIVQNEDHQRDEQTEIDILQVRTPIHLPTSDVPTGQTPPTQVNSYASSSIQEREVGHFTKVQVGSSFDVFISQGDRDNVRLEVDERYINDVITEVKGNVLYVKLKNNTKVKNPDKLDIYLTMQTIEGFNFSGAINAKSLNTLSGDKLKIDCSGASDMELDLQFDEIDIVSSGASELDLKGKANQFVLSGSGASEINAKDFVVENSKMTISGASEIKCNVTGDLKISASGASDVEYQGNPRTVDINSSGASSVKKRN